MYNNDYLKLVRSLGDQAWPQLLHVLVQSSECMQHNNYYITKLLRRYIGIDPNGGHFVSSI